MVLEYMNDIVSFKNMNKRDTIIFPRLVPEKQLDIFKDLEKELPESMNFWLHSKNKS